MPRTYVIYIPGLGDGYDRLRRFCLKAWSIYGVNVDMISSSWSNGESFDIKKQRIIDAIEQAHQRGERIVLLGESAGGSMALNVYASHSQYVSRVVTLCGKNTRPENVSPILYKRNEAFRTSMQRVGEATDSLSLTERQRVTSIYPFYDPTVPIAETFIPDCRKVRIWSVGHIVSILIGLTIGAFVVVREAKRD